MVTRRSILPVLALVAAALAAGAGAIRAEPSSPAVQEKRQPPLSPDAESEYNRGVRARLAKDWASAVDAFTKAIALRRRFPEAWNELGYAFRNQGRYEESLAAYQEALRQRPSFPEALEYLGEAYVKMGRLDEARQVLKRLRPLDPHRADELAEVIAKGK